MAFCCFCSLCSVVYITWQPLGVRACGGTVSVAHVAIAKQRWPCGNGYYCPLRRSPLVLYGESAGSLSSFGLIFILAFDG